MKTRTKWILPGLLIGFLTLLGVSGCQPSTREQPMNTKSDPTRAAPAVPALDQAQPESFATATFSMGWFWGPDSQFGSTPGVIRTRVGYAGGESDSPTYRSIGDQSETIQIDYDPSVISYEELLNLFWDNHSPTSRSSSRQYASIIHYNTEEERLLAEKTRQEQEEALGTKVYTEIVPLGTFTLAENYHQKYYLQNRKELMPEFSAIYPDFEDFINSTAAARVNGYLGYNGTVETLQKEIDQMGLSTEAQEILLRFFRK